MSLRSMARAAARRAGVPVGTAYNALTRTRPAWGTEDRVDAAVDLLRREMRSRNDSPTVGTAPAGTPDKE